MIIVLDTHCFLLAPAVPAEPMQSSQGMQQVRFASHETHVHVHEMFTLAICGKKAK